MELDAIIGIYGWKLAESRVVVAGQVGFGYDRKNVWAADIYIEHHRGFALTTVGVYQQSGFGGMFILLTGKNFDGRHIVFHAADGAFEDKAQPS